MRWSSSSALVHVKDWRWQRSENSNRVPPKQKYKVCSSQLWTASLAEAFSSHSFSDSTKEHWLVYICSCKPNTSCLQLHTITIYTCGYLFAWGLPACPKLRVLCLTRCPGKPADYSRWEMKQTTWMGAGKQREGSFKDLPLGVLCSQTTRSQPEDWLPRTQCSSP